MNRKGREDLPAYHLFCYRGEDFEFQLDIGADPGVVEQVFVEKRYSIQTAIFTICIDDISRRSGNFEEFKQHGAESSAGIVKHFTVLVEGYHSETEARITAEAAAAVERFFGENLRLETDLVKAIRNHMDVVAGVAAPTSSKVPATQEPAYSVKEYITRFSCVVQSAGTGKSRIAKRVSLAYGNRCLYSNFRRADTFGFPAMNLWSMRLPGTFRLTAMDFDRIAVSMRYIAFAKNFGVSVQGLPSSD